MKTLVAAVISILLAIGCAIVGLRTLAVEDQPRATTPPRVSSPIIAAVPPMQRRVSLPSQPSQNLEPIDIPQLASKKILYTSGIPNGQYRAIAVDDGWNLDCYLVEVASKKVKFTFSGPAKGAYYAEISPKESYLASSRIFDRKIVLWSIETGEVAIELPGHETFTCGLTFSPDERRLASLSVKGEVCVWDLAEQTVMVRQDVPLEQFKSFEFDSDQQLSIQLQDKSIQLDVPSEQEVASVTEAS